MVREATTEELYELTQYIRNDYGMTVQEASELVSVASVAVFPDYISDSPDYAGKVMIVVWTADPGTVNSYTWRDGVFTKEEIDKGV